MQIFFVPKFSDTARLLKDTGHSFNPWVFFDGTLYTLGLDRPNFNLLFISIVILAIVDIIQEKGVKIRETIARQNIIIRWVIYYAGIFSIIIFGMYGPGYDATSFIYQRF